MTITRDIIERLKELPEATPETADHAETLMLIEMAHDRPRELAGNEQGERAAPVYMLGAYLVNNANTGETAPGNSNVSAVSLDHWRTSLAGAGIIDRNNSDTARVQFNRLKKALANKQKIEISEGLAWLA